MKRFSVVIALCIILSLSALSYAAHLAAREEGRRTELLAELNRGREANCMDINKLKLSLQDILTASRETNRKAGRLTTEAEAFYKNAIRNLAVVDCSIQTGG